MINWDDWASAREMTGSEGVLWAAEHADLEMLQDLLDTAEDEDQPLPSLPEALEAARGWLTVDEEAEARRRGAAGAPERVPHGDGSYQVVRVGVYGLAHRAVVTELERRLGVEPAAVELLERALHYGDPASVDWLASVVALGTREPAIDQFRWAAARIGDPRVLVRRFAADLVELLSYERPPFQGEAAEAVRPRLAAESDAGVLLSLVKAYAEYRQPQGLSVLIPLARHADPAVRVEVAWRLDDLATLFELADDPVARVRANALANILRTDRGSSGALAAYARHRDDRDEEVRVEALAGLARHGDDVALEELRAIAERQPGWVARSRYDGVVAERSLHFGQ
ncbi:HEAT repeat domain-containing protein [Actinoplanes solisilvae]|uniref:HEAT repeat domain-containing protein n=1 Tax=Actinoplanes solisilvae TaxID=2486853 RepID=UPI000FD81BB4|nr:hypothetical protein [Actinoplanes solisilvae]